MKVAAKSMMWLLSVLIRMMTFGAFLSFFIIFPFLSGLGCTSMHMITEAADLLLGSGLRNQLLLNATLGWMIVIFRS